MVFFESVTLVLASLDGSKERNALVSESRSVQKPRRPREEVTSPILVFSTSPVSPQYAPKASRRANGELRLENPVLPDC